MNHPLLWGICGCGGIAGELAQAIAAAPGHRVQAVAARDPARAARFAAAQGAPVVHASYAELCADPAVDVVYIATVHSTHYPLLQQALMAGKAVVCEKPLVLTEAQARAAVELARSRKLFLLEKMWIRFLPVILQLHEAIDAGRLGAVRQVRCDFSFFAAFHPASRLYDPAQAGGATLDVGCYPLALIQDFLGSAEECHSVATLGATGVDETVAFVSRHAGGRLGVATAGINGAGPRSFEIIGSEAMASAPSAWPPGEVTIRRRDGTVLETIHADANANGYQPTLREVARCLAAGEIESPRMTHAQSIELARWMEAAWRRAGVQYPKDILRA